MVSAVQFFLPLVIIVGVLAGLTAMFNGLAGENPIGPVTWFLSDAWEGLSLFSLFLVAVWGFHLTSYLLVESFARDVWMVCRAVEGLARTIPRRTRDFWTAPVYFVDLSHSLTGPPLPPDSAQVAGYGIAARRFGATGIGPGSLSVVPEFPHRGEDWDEGSSSFHGGASALARRDLGLLNCSQRCNLRQLYSRFAGWRCGTGGPPGSVEVYQKRLSQRPEAVLSVRPVPE